jgi:hypothetical protein
MLPELRDDDREQFALAISRFFGRPGTEMPIVFRDPLEPLIEQPPWVFARPIPPDKAGQSDAVAYVVAVDIHNDEPWLIRAYLGAGASGLGLTRIGIEHFEDSTREVSSGTLKDGIRIGTIRDRALSKLRDAPLYVQAKKALGWAPASGEEDRAASVAAAAQRPRRGGRQAHKPDYLRWLAHEYLAVLETPRARWARRNLHAELAKRSQTHLGLEYTPRPDTIRTQLREATLGDRGFLIGGTRGRRYSPGPNLYERKEDE